MEYDQIETGFERQKNKRNKCSEKISENRTRFEVEEDCSTAMDSHEKLLRKLAIGRAYQIIMIKAAIRYTPLERLETQRYMSSMGAGCDKQHIAGGVPKTYPSISRFFDTISKEAIMIRDVDENVLFGEIARSTRVEREAAEANRRHLEIKARGEQDEMFKQVMKIHQNISELVNDRLTNDVIDEYTNEVATRLTKNVIAKRNKTGRGDEHILQELQDFLIHFANTR